MYHDAPDQSLPTAGQRRPDVAKGRHLEQLGYDAVGMADVIRSGTPPRHAGGGPGTHTGRHRLPSRTGSGWSRGVSLPLEARWRGMASQIQTLLQQLSGGGWCRGVGVSAASQGSPFAGAAAGSALLADARRGRWTDTALRALPGPDRRKTDPVGSTD
ncbi:hypothetical protein GCM10020220_023830 [Nonomuraea rubra]